MRPLTQAQVRALLAKRHKYNATRSACAAGHAHPSKMEARVCQRLQGECAVAGTTLFVGPSFPLFSLAPDAKGKTQTWRPDFAIWDGRTLRIVEAKGKASRDFWLRVRAFQSTWPGITVEVVSA